MQKDIKDKITTVCFIAYFAGLPTSWALQYLYMSISTWECISMTIYGVAAVLAVKYPCWYFPYFFDKPEEEEYLSPSERRVREEVGKEFVEKFSGFSGDVHIPEYDDTVSVKVGSDTAVSLYEHLFPDAGDKKSSKVSRLILLREVSVDSPIIYIVAFRSGSLIGGTTKTTEVGTIDSYAKIEDFLRDMNLLDVV